MEFKRKGTGFETDHEFPPSVVLMMVPFDPQANITTGLIDVMSNRSLVLFVVKDDHVSPLSVDLMNFPPFPAPKNMPLEEWSLFNPVGIVMFILLHDPPASVLLMILFLSVPRSRKFPEAVTEVNASMSSNGLSDVNCPYDTKKKEMKIVIVYFFTVKPPT
jgi:hypothetical protein